MQKLLIDKFKLQRQFTLILQARDEASAGVIEEASYSGIVLPGPVWHTLDHQGKNAHLAYRVRVQCADHYYNATCTKFCRPRNDIFGHYTCDENGDKVCIQGWKGVDCETGKQHFHSILTSVFDSFRYCRNTFFCEPIIMYLVTTFRMVFFSFSLLFGLLFISFGCLFICLSFFVYLFVYYVVYYSNCLVSSLFYCLFFLVVCLFVFLVVCKKVFFFIH